MKGFLTLLAAVVVIASPALALTISQTGSFGGIPDITGPLTFNQFDDNGGLWILQSVQVSIAIQASGGSMHLDNDSPLPADVNFTYGITGMVSSTDVTLKNAAAQYIPLPAVASFNASTTLAPNVGDIPGDYDTTAPDGAMYNGGVVISDVQSDFVGQAFWGDGTKGFLGNGTFDIDYYATQWLNFSSTGGIEYRYNPATAAGMVTVLYTYDIIPEPYTILLLTFGSLLLRRRKWNFM
ncbi:MAG: choice-of-anchor E domain-containing protein [Sedimentisphaerales bacterium]|nr:choice-of-anchor E domain-containing protein [Sedimentisphaerales bacterium]